MRTAAPISAADLQLIIDRQDYLFSNVPRCPKCGVDQVQIIRMDAPAAWRCRMCREAFVCEPYSEVEMAA